jgi:hypothetical protein
MNTTEAKIELMLLEADSNNLTKEFMYTWLHDKGLPDEVSIRLINFSELMAKIGSKSVNIGRVIFKRLYEFVEQNPNLSIGIAVGAVIGMLTASVPLIGPFLAPITTSLGLVLGISVGNMMDEGKSYDNTVFASIESAIVLAKKFYILIIDIFTSIKNELVIA